MFEDHVIGPAVLDDHGEAIEILHPAFDFGAVHETDVDGQFFTPRVIQEDVLDIRLSGGGPGLTCCCWHRGGSPWPRGHGRPPPESPRVRLRRGSTVDLALSDYRSTTATCISGIP